MKRIFITFFVFISFALTAQESVLLRLNYNEGDRYIVTVEQNNMTGLKESMNMKMSMDMLFTEIKKDTIKSESKLTSIVMEMFFFGTKMSYDSSKKEEDLDEIEKGLKSEIDPMMRATIFNSMNRFGKTIDAKIEPSTAGMDEFTNQSGSISYPKDKVSVGSFWEGQEENKGMTMNSTYTVRKIEAGTVFINISGVVTGVGQGTIEGKMEIDVKTGTQKKSEVKVVIAVEGQKDVTVNTKLTMIKA